MKQSDVNWFRPLWRRLLVTGIVAVWLCFELLFSHDPLWIGVSGIGVAYCLWNFFLRFPGNDAPPTDPTSRP